MPTLAHTVPQTITVPTLPQANHTQYTYPPYNVSCTQPTYQTPMNLHPTHPMTTTYTTPTLTHILPNPTTITLTNLIHQHQQLQQQQHAVQNLLNAITRPQITNPYTPPTILQPLGGLPIGGIQQPLLPIY